MPRPTNVLDAVTDIKSNLGSLGEQERLQELENLVFDFLSAFINEKAAITAPQFPVGDELKAALSEKIGEARRLFDEAGVSSNTASFQLGRLEAFQAASSLIEGSE
jgi:hypothetical protein